mgnify:FL=1
MHGKLDLTKAKGLKKSEIKMLDRLLQERIPEGKILTIDLAEAMAEFSHETGSVVSAAINRRGQVVSVTVGHPRDVETPELKGLRTGPGRLCGHRLVYTTLAAGESGISKED